MSRIEEVEPEQLGPEEFAEIGRRVTGLQQRHGTINSPRTPQMGAWILSWKKREPPKKIQKFAA